MVNQSQQSCPICRNTYHVHENGVWKRCVCLTKRLGTQANTLAGIEPYLNHGGWFGFQNKPKFVRALKSIKPTYKRSLILYGNKPTVRWKVAALVLENCAKGGSKIAACGLNELVDWHFRDLEKFYAIVSSDVFWLRCDFPRKHSWNTSIVRDTLVSRGHQKLTIVSTGVLFDLEPAEIVPINLEGLVWKSLA